MVLGKLLGIDLNSLAKLTIRYEKDHEHDWRGRITALFNPSELSISQGVNWKTHGGGTLTERTAIEQQFRSVSPRTTSVELFFDSYEDHDGSGLFGFLPNLNPFPSPDATDVRRYTDELARLAAVVPELHRPPLCKLSWGAFDDIFTGVLTNVSGNYTMFMPSGMPVRATVSCDFTEHQVQSFELFSPDVDKRHVVAPGDTLHGIAARVYDDPTKWRILAEANGITRPRDLTPGTTVVVPKLKRGR